MNSLKAKILCLTTFIVVVAIGIIGWQNLKNQQAIMTSLSTRYSQILGEAIRNSITTDMANGQNQKISLTLQKIQKESSIDAVRIFDPSGRILRSSNPDEIGSLISSSELLAYRSGKQAFTNTGPSGQETFHSNVPILNAQSCHSCHNPNDKLLGILNVEMSIAGTEALREQGQTATLVASLGCLAFLVLSITAFFLYYVDMPIRKLTRAMTLVEIGDFNNALLSEQSSREMSLLSGKFNLMVNRLKTLINTTVDNEKALAVTREKLAHHTEMEKMNKTLEDRLQEIEDLNLDLEERIEEIEEANYKIADLASDLESKNSTLQMAVSRLSALNNIGLAINSTMELDTLFELLIAKTAETLGAQTGAVLLLDDSQSALTIGAAVGVSGHIDMDMQVPLGEGSVSHRAIMDRKPVLIQNINASKGFNKLSPLGYIRETVMCAPLIINDKIFGTITVTNKKDQTAYTADDLELLSTIAAQASATINNAHLYLEQQNTYLCTVQALVSTIEASDTYTRGHSERVTQLCTCLAKYMNMPDQTIRRLERAAILHDIGKIGIGVTLLHKKGKLSQEDIETLRQHPTIGVKILEPIPFLKDIVKIIEQHHERFDGYGYPHGIGGDELLIESKILAVADTYDAMTSNRPYRKALAHHIAIKEISENSGRQFDPRVAQAFIEMSEGTHLIGQFVNQNGPQQAAL